MGVRVPGIPQHTVSKQLPMGQTSGCKLNMVLPRRQLWNTMAPAYRQALTSRDPL